MTGLTFKSFRPDRGGRRKIADRRFNVATKHDPERRTGWKRRNGLDRRFRQIGTSGVNRRRGWPSEHSEQ
ncbi:MAG: hypothetical protein MI892_29555 [Desulfobacterales bacterium]|nr:hypothetical protein [Desulfobacterales bacterium]